MYVNGKMILVKAIPGMRERVMKENSGEGCIQVGYI
jgi:hypothetical protein